MKNNVAKLLIAILLLCLVLCGCSTQPAAPTGTEPSNTETEVLEYPGKTGIEFPEYANIVPDIVFTTSGEENGLIGELYMVIGTVEEYFASDGGLGCLRVRTVKGDVVILDPASSYELAGSEEGGYKVDLEKLRSYLPLPKEGEFCVIFAEYQGMSNTFDCPSFIYSSTDYLTDALILSFLDDSDSVGSGDSTPAGSDKTDGGNSTTPDEPPQATQPAPTTGEKNALAKANQYLSAMPFSHSGLIEQLEYEGFSKDEATYAADHCGADWNEQAEKKAQQYVELMSFTRSELISQLKYEGFTKDQAAHGADYVGL